MRRLIKWLVLPLIFVGLFFWFAKQPGFILITFQHYAFQISLGFAVLSILALSIILLFFVKLFHLPHRIKLAWLRWQENRRQKAQAQKAAMEKEKIQWNEKLHQAAEKDIVLLRNTWSSMPNKYRDTANPSEI